MDPQLKATCRQTIYVARASTTNGFGDVSYGTPVPMQARVEDDVEDSDVGSEGVERRTRKRIMTEGRILTTDRVWLPGDSPATASLGRQPLKVQELPDELGVIDHYETLV